MTLNLAPTGLRFNLPPLQRWIGFLALCLGMAMAILDIQIVVTSLPVIEKAFGIGPDQMSWVQTSYLIAEIITIPLSGLLIRVFSVRKLFLWSIIAFTIASLACAGSHTFVELLLARVAQGAAGGVLIPLVFAAVFLFFPPGWQNSLAVAMAGFLAVLAPTTGPLIGGWLTQNYSWHWLFLVNVIPGIVGTLLGYTLLPRFPMALDELKRLDWFSLLLLAVGLASLLIGLKDAPKSGWLAANVVGWFILSIGAIYWLWRRPNPVIMFHLLEDRSMFFGCVLSFITGFTLFANVYLIPVFMAYVRSHTPLEIGFTTMVMGLSQLITMPFAVQADRMFNARPLAALGFLVFGIGLLINANFTVASDSIDYFWPQLLRGIATGFIILPPIRFALALMPLDKVGDASGLFNVTRNIGGAIGIAVVDTIIWQRTPEHAANIMALAKSSPEAAAKILNIPATDMPEPGDMAGFLGIQDFVQGAALTMAINEGWIILGIVALLALPALWWLGPVRSALPLKELMKLK